MYVKLQSLTQLETKKNKTKKQNFSIELHIPSSKIFPVKLATNRRGTK